LFVLVYFDRLRPERIGPLKVKPRGLVQRDFKLEELPELGVFALDSPTRPNPIGLTLVRVVKREENRIVVQGLDFFDARRFSISKAIVRSIVSTSLRFPNGFGNWLMRRDMCKQAGLFGEKERIEHHEEHEVRSCNYPNPSCPSYYYN
jgi:hypothetical protein